MLFKLIKYILRVYFLYSEKLRSWHWPDHRLKILFSCKPDWEPRIRKGFLFTGHQVDFKNFSTVSLNNYDLVVPLTYEDLDFLNTVGFQSDRFWLPRPSSNVAHLCHDKFKFILKANELGFSRYIPKIVANDEFPLVLKRKTDTWGKNTHIVKDASEYASLIQSINTDDYYHQELILGAREFATHVVFICGKIVNSVTIEHFFKNDMPINGKDQNFSVMSKCSYIDIFSDLLNAIGFEGLCCIDYKVKNGIPYIFEINPRFGGSLSFYFFSFLRHLNKK